MHRPGFFASAKPELLNFGFGESLRGQRHYSEAAQAYEEAGNTPSIGPELRVRTMLAAGQCRDLTGERQLAVHDYNVAIETGPNTNRADAARKYLRSPYKDD